MVERAATRSIASRQGSGKEVNLPYETTNAAKLGSLQKLAASIAANIPELSHMEQSCLQFVSMVGNLQEVSKQQAALVADKQEASKQFKTLLIECQRLAFVLRGRFCYQAAPWHPIGEARRVQPAAVPRPEVEEDAAGARARPARA